MIIKVPNFIHLEVANLLYFHILKCKERFQLAKELHIYNRSNKNNLAPSWNNEFGYYRDDKDSNAYAMYSNPIFEDLLDISTNKVSDIVKLELVPIYSFISLYEKDTLLKKHTDRKECEISMSLCLGYNPEETSWPLFIGDQNIKLKAGDAVIYNGVDSEHWREPFQGINQAQAFFHWTDKNGFFGDKFKFDGRFFLGYRKIY